MEIIAFRILKASLRGTEIAIYDYADANEKILGNVSIILIQENAEHCSEIVHKFSSRFATFTYNPGKIESIEEIMLANCSKVLYTIAHGSSRVNDPTLSTNGVYRTALHCVFTLEDPHADTYVPISEYLAQKYGRTEYVPHMISLPGHIKDDFRERLGIPKNAVVFGRHGGAETFDIDFVHQTIREILDETENVWFVFVNTNRFHYHKRLIHINSIVDLDQKTRFINTCDAMIHARCGGETFGIACGEFSVMNKPVITHKSFGDKAHLDILGEKCLTYETSIDLKNIFCNFKNIKDRKEKEIGGSHPWDAYSSKYSSKRVIEEWWKLLIYPCLVQQ